MEERLFPDSVPEHLLIARRKEQTVFCVICGVQANVIKGKYHLCNTCCYMIRKGEDPWERKNLQKEVK